MITAETKSEMGYIFLGMVGGASVGTFIFQLLGTAISVLVGTIVSYLFVKLIKPKLDKFFDNLKNKKKNASKKKEN